MYLERDTSNNDVFRYLIDLIGRSFWVIQYTCASMQCPHRVKLSSSLNALNILSKRFFFPSFQFETSAFRTDGFDKALYLTIILGLIPWCIHAYLNATNKTSIQLFISTKQISYRLTSWWVIKIQSSKKQNIYNMGNNYSGCVNYCIYILWHFNISVINLLQNCM